MRLSSSAVFIACSSLRAWPATPGIIYSESSIPASITCLPPVTTSSGVIRFLQKSCSDSRGSTEFIGHAVNILLYFFHSPFREFHAFISRAKKTLVPWAVARDTDEKARCLTRRSDHSLFILVCTLSYGSFLLRLNCRLLNFNIFLSTKEICFISSVTDISPKILKDFP